MVKLYFSEIRNFVFEEQGAVSIDYLVLLAGTIALSIAGTAAIRSSTSDVSGSVGTAAQDVETAASF
jgi:Flp pilus assembly pilin Flp